MITKSEVKENLSIFTKTFSIIPWETHLVLSAISTIMLAFFGSARLNSSKIDSDIILTLAPKSAIAFMLNISTEQGIVRLLGFGFSVDEGFYDGDLNGPYIWYSAIVISSALIPTPGAWFCVSSRYCSIVRSLMSTTSMMFPREYIEVEFFEGWKPLSPLQLAVEEVMFKLERWDVKGALECMKILGFMHGITNPELIKRAKEVTSAMEAIGRWAEAKFQKGRFSESTKARTKARQVYSPYEIPKEILALDKGKFKAPPPMTTLVEKRNNNKFCKFHGEVGHNTDECIWRVSLRNTVRTLLQQTPSRNKESDGSGYGTPYQFNGEIIWPMVRGGILTLKSSKIIPLECAVVLGLERQPPATTQVTKEKIKVSIHPEYPKQTIAIRFTLTKEVRKELYDLLRHNLDIFTWKPADMTGVPRHIAKHWLNMWEGCTLLDKRKGAKH
ncbi:hypothetical protein Tco_1194085 [Tanacetum coccineum]